MASQLLDIYATLAARTITMTSAALGALQIAARGLDDSLDALESGHLPVRQLQPFSNRGDGRLLSAFVTAGRGGLPVVEWGIADVCFWRAAAAGVGLSDASGDLVRYMAAYVTMLRELVEPTWSIAGAVLTVESFEWPLQGGRWYDGVIARLTIREIVT